uniref:BTB domain-containing protein n=1 Tax=Arcella intermedia TaxID=1963864 RepID=A0A6B2L260_9EUKA
MYVFGGYDNQTGLSNDLYELNIETNTWKLLSDNNLVKPSPRYSHVSVILKTNTRKYVLIFGGRGAQSLVFNDIWRYDIHLDKWEPLKVKSHSKVPKGRYACASFFDKEKLELVIHGGYDGNNTVFNDMWSINLNSKELVWKEIGTSMFKKEFLPRYHHTIHRLSGTGLIIFGGRNNEHNICNFIEEGEYRGRECIDDIFQLSVNPAWNEDVIVDWLKSIYEGNLTKEVVFGYPCPDYHFASYIVQKRMRELSHHTQDQFNDITFVLNGGKISAHKILLQSQSRFFEAFLGNGMLETNSSEIYLPHVDIEAFAILKEYLYGLEPEFTVNTVIPAIVLANQFTVDDFQLRCINFIVGHIEEYSIFEILNLSIQLKSLLLEDFCIWYLIVNYKQFADSIEFYEMDSKLKTRVLSSRWPGELFEKDFNNYQKKLQSLRNQQTQEDLSLCSLQ